MAEPRLPKEKQTAGQAILCSPLDQGPSIGPQTCKEAHTAPQGYKDLLTGFSAYHPRALLQEKLPRSNSEPDLAEPRSWGPIVADVGEALSREREGHIQLDVCQKEEARSQACVEDETLQSVWQSHLAGNCLPCIFIWRKDDGCRHGDACTHCHFCPPEEAKRKRNRMSWESKKRNKAAARR